MQDAKVRSCVENTDYFRQIPWCATLIEDRSYQVIPGITQKLGAKPGTNKLLSKTLTYSEAIKATVALRRKASAGQGKPQVMVLIAIGGDLDGHENTLHGGVSAIFLDEVAGLALDMYNSRFIESNTQFFTAKLHVSYRRPVRTPQILLGCADLVNESDRKAQVVVDLKDKEGVVLCHADATFAKVKAPLSL